MNFVLLMGLVFFGPLLLFVAFLALSSCLGDSFRARLRRLSIRPGVDAYDRHYLRTMTNTGSAMSEQIELDEMIREEQYEEEHDR
ncbi:hypothetical protein VTN77DRAFT_2407 [Rasamsonia byssochlamydoides]|uniref:uncharacterized protein n=1 Tax=Rasamsonia byssochlamydoides TaxID=89139 RepID=UPI0037420814